MARGAKGEYTSRIINVLARDGENIVRKAALSKNTNNITNNEKDSFVYGVYYMGKLVKWGHASPSQTATEKFNAWTKKGTTIIEADFGYNVAKDTITNFVPSIKGGIELVVLVTTYYSAINEKRGYKIISQAKMDIDALIPKYKGSTTRVIDIRNGQT